VNADSTASSTPVDNSLCDSINPAPCEPSEERTNYSSDDSADDYFGTMFEFTAENGGEFGVGLRSNGFFVAVEWVPGHVESEHFAFECEFVFAFPFFIGDLHGKEVVYSPTIPAAVTTKSGKEIELPFIGGVPCLAPTRNLLLFHNAIRLRCTAFGSEAQKVKTSRKICSFDRNLATL